MTKCLQWYRDKGNGQQACDYFSAVEEWVGNWPIAQLAFETEAERDTLWNALYQRFGVNAMAQYFSYSVTV